MNFFVAVCCVTMNVYGNDYILPFHVRACMYCMDFVAATVAATAAAVCSFCCCISYVQSNVLLSIFYTVCALWCDIVVVVALCENDCCVLHVFVMRARHSFHFSFNFSFFAMIKRERALTRSHTSNHSFIYKAFVDQSPSSEQERHYQQ